MPVARTQPGPKFPTIRIRPQGWLEHMVRAGIFTHAELFRRMDVTHTSWWRARLGQNVPSGDFTRKALHVLRTACWDDLFVLDYGTGVPPQIDWDFAGEYHRQTGKQLASRTLVDA